MALLLAVQVVRLALIDRFADASPALASRVWPTHPGSVFSNGMLEIAAATRERRPVPPQTIDRVLRASAKAPLADDPFLVRGVQAQMIGDSAAAGRAFTAAKRRNPRSLPARYFLADHYLRAGDARSGLREVAALSRLTPGGADHLAPYVASFARDSANWRHVRTLFRADASLANATLAALATEARNADVVMALASTQRRGSQKEWLPNLLASLIKAGQFTKARAVWASASQVALDSGTLLYDPDFSRPQAPPPFNWSLASSSIGFAERRRGGGLNLIFYGQQDGVLASQLLVLGPGRYRMTVNAPSLPGGAAALNWTLICATSQAAIATASLQSVVSKPWTFTVPAGCAAQRLELSGRSSDLAQQRAEVTISSVRLQQEQSGG